MQFDPESWIAPRVLPRMRQLLYFDCSYFYPIYLPGAFREAPLAANANHWPSSDGFGFIQCSSFTYPDGRPPSPFRARIMTIVLSLATLPTTWLRLSCTGG
jgi:hypothetical protein